LHHKLDADNLKNFSIETLDVLAHNFFGAIRVFIQKANHYLW